MSPVTAAPPRTTSAPTSDEPASEIGPVVVSLSADRDADAEPASGTGDRPPAGERRPSGWAAHEALALAVQVLVTLTPSATAMAAAWVLGRVLPQPSAMVLTVARLTAILAASALTLAGTRVALRRLAPLPFLLRLSLAFPDETPKRLRLAMRVPSARELEKRLTELDASGSAVQQVEPADVAAEIVGLVASISTHHRLTRGHSERVRAYADLIAVEMGLSEDERHKLRWAALLHDVGKITVPTEILDKKGKPDEDEWAVLAGHPAASALLTSALRDWMGPWWNGIGEHHERWDGTGYPDRLAGRKISLAGRIVALADSFETMTAVRSYKRAMSLRDARAEVVRSAGKHFDPEVVRAFLNIGLRRLRRAAGIAAWLPVPAVAAVRQLLAAAAPVVQAPAAVAVAGAVAVNTFVPAIRAETVVAPRAGRVVIAVNQDGPQARASLPAITVSIVDVLSSPGPTDPGGAPIGQPSVVVPANGGVASSDPLPPAAIGAGATGEPASPALGSPVTSGAVSPGPPTTVAAVTTARTAAPAATTVATRPPAVTLPTTSAPSATTPKTSTAGATTPALTLPPVTAPVANVPVTTAPVTTAPVTTAPATTTSAVPVAVTSAAAPTWLARPTVAAAGDGRNLKVSGISIDSHGQSSTSCTLALAGTTVSATGPCSRTFTLSAPMWNTTYTVVATATTGAGATSEATVAATTGPKVLVIDASTHWPCPGTLCGSSASSFATPAAGLAFTVQSRGTSVLLLCRVTGGLVDTRLPWSSGTETSSLWVRSTLANPYLSVLSFPTVGETAADGLPTC